MTRPSRLPPGAPTGPAHTRLGTTTWPDARRAAAALATALPPVRRAAADALGCVLAEPLRAPTALPATDVSAMDGFAVCGPGPWRILGQVLAGDPVPPPLPTGAAYQVATGTALPDGVAAVLRAEDAAVVDDAGVVWVDVPAAGPHEAGCCGGARADRGRTDVASGRNVRRRGEECRAGEELVHAGFRVGPTTLGLAAALGVDELCVRPRPRVACVVSGDELRLGGAPGDGRIRDAIGPMLPGLVEAAGGDLVGVRHVPDSRAALVAALHTDADVVLVSGASARGPADHLRGALSDVGAVAVVDGVACRPGHPQGLFRRDDGPLVVSLPGNPLAALAAFTTLAVPVLAGLAGVHAPEPTPLPTTRPVERHPVDTRLLPVRVIDGRACPAEYAGAAMLRGAAVADGFAVVEPGRVPTSRVGFLPFA